MSTETKICEFPECKALAELQANGFIYCRPHYVEVNRRSSNHDQRVFVLQNINVVLAEGPHAGSKAEFRLGKMDKRFWMSVAHIQSTIKDGKPDEQKKSITLQNLGPGDLRRIARGMKALADEMDSRLNQPG